MSRNQTDFPFFCGKADAVELYYTLPRAWRVAIYGTGGAGTAFRKFVETYRPDLCVRCFVDSFSAGTKDGLPVATPDQDLVREVDAIVVCSYMHHGIVATLQARGLTRHVVYKDPGREAALYFSEYFAPLTRALDQAGAGYDPLAPAYLAAHKEAYLGWMLAQLRGQCQAGKINIVSAICWLNERDRKELLEMMAADISCRDIAGRLANVNLIGFDPDDFPRSAADDLLYDHWSEEAMRCVEALSREQHVVTTIAHTMRIRGLDLGNVSYLGYEQIAAEARRQLLPPVQRFMDEAARAPGGGKHLVLFGMSSEILVSAIQDMLREQCPAYADGYNTFFRIYSGLEPLEAALRQVLACREELGQVLLVVSASIAQALEESGLLNTMRFHQVRCQTVRTRQLLLRSVQESVAKFLRGG